MRSRNCCVSSPSLARLLGVVLLLGCAQGHAVNLDIDGDGIIEPSVDGQLILQHLFGFADDELITDLLTANSARSPSQVRAYLSSIHSDLDVDGNGEVDALTDGILLVRRISGESELALTGGAVAPNATRTSPADIAAYIDSLLDAAPLAATLQASPESGVSPVEVSFTATARGGLQPYVYAWDFDGDSVTDSAQASAAYTFTGVGSKLARLTVTDALGAETSLTQEITLLAAPLIEASAVPAFGAPPLQVTFSAMVSDADGEPALFEWDFDGNGSIDSSSALTGTATHTYAAVGRYQAHLRVTDDNGLTSNAVIEVSVGVPPAAQATADPVAGHAPLAVTLTPDGSDADGTIASYEWDLDGDGTFDLIQTTPAPYEHIFEESGTYLVSLRVTDQDGLRATDTLLITVAGPPEAIPGAHPLQGDAPLTVTFFANGRDLDGSPKFYDWDYDGDGTIDEHLLASQNSEHTFTAPGSYDARLTVTDDDGLTGSTTVRIEVTPPDQASTLPTAIAAVSPSNGGAPLDVLLTGTGHVPQGSIVLFEWDLDGDGNFDWQESASEPEILGLRIDAGNNAKPLFHDLDADGDLDLLVGGSDGRIYRYENIGAPSAARWRYDGPLTATDGSIVDVGSGAAPVLGDLDGDGDADLLLGNSYGRFEFYLNQSATGGLAFAYQAALLDQTGAVIDLGSYTTPVLLDADGDGDLDVIAGERSGGLLWLENIGTAAAWGFASPIALANEGGVVIDLGSYTTPTVADLDGDTNPELLVGRNADGVYLFSIDASGEIPQLVSQATPVDVGGADIYTARSYEAPTAADIDADGDLDLFLGDSYGNLSFYRNLGDPQAPSWWRVTGYYNDPDLSARAVPALFDVDDDGDLDLLLGASGGSVYLYENVGDPMAPIWTPIGSLADADGNQLDTGSNSAPIPFDLDDDGDLDLLVGEHYGRLAYCLNSGGDWLQGWDCSSGFLATATGQGGIDIGYRAKPFSADIDLDGDLDLFIGESDGTINLYLQGADGASRTWTSEGSLELSDGTLIDVGNDSAPSLVDLDGDGDLDLVVGAYDGAFHVFLNDAGPGDMLWRFGGYLGGMDVGSYAAPAWGDLDADGDPDLIYGDGDGDRFMLMTVGSVRHTYDQPGTYNPRLRVTDDQGNSATDTVQVRVAAEPVPQVYVVASPRSGIAPLTVTFNGGANASDADIVRYEWDFDGDGVFETSDPTPATAHTYSAPGDFVATLRATDSLGRHGLASIAIDVDFALESTRTSAFSPAQGGVAAITTSLNGPIRLRVLILDSVGNLLRTLVDASRPAGEYEDPWDGRNDQGELVGDGVYYYVVEYQEDGQWQRIDLRDEAEYAVEEPARSWTSAFDPYSGEPLEVSYTLTHPSEVSLYFWTRRGGSSGIDTIDTDRTLILREPRDAGSHTEVWDGVDDKGVLVESDVQYPLTLWAYTLPDNAIIVSGNRPEITEISASPVYFSPAYNPYGPPGSGGVSIAFRASEAGSALIRILNSAGQVVARPTGVTAQAGLNRFVWNGRTLDGQPVAPGAYSVEVIVVDAEGNRSLPRHAAVVARY